MAAIRLLAVVVLAVGIAISMAACGGGSGSSPAPPSAGPAPPVDPGCDGSCANATTFLSVTDVQTVIAQAVAEAHARNEAATVAVVDRVGNVLAVFRMLGANPSARPELVEEAVTISSTPPGSASGISGGLEGIMIIPDVAAAISKAVTGAYLSSEGNAFTTRTASQIVQEHFNPGEAFQPAGPLFGVQFSQLACSDLSTRFSAGSAATAGPHRSPLGLAADSGGLPLYKSGTPVGGIGVIADGLYSADKDPTGDIDADVDEFIALAATAGFEAPVDRLASRITADGKTFRYSDARYDDLQSDPASAPTFASINTIAGALIPVTGYYDGTAILTGTPFGQPVSGIRPDTQDYPGQDVYVLVDDNDIERYPPVAGTDNLLTAVEVQTLVSSALAVAQRARAQIRRPLGTAARVSVSVVDTNGAILAVARSRDAPVFGIDVSLQKARTATFFSSAGAAATLSGLPPAAYLDGDLTLLRTESLADYVGAAQTFLGLPTALTDGAIAFSDRAGGNLSRPFYPDGIDNTANGPFSKPAGQWSVFSVGLQLDLVYNALINHVGFTLGLVPDVGQNCSGVSGIDAGTAFAVSGASTLLANGIQIFPGSVPVYRGSELIGGIGVSGDGVDQDDLIAFLGLHEAGEMLGTINNAPAAMRADTLTPMGTRLRYINCPQTPYLASDEQNVCANK